MLGGTAVSKELELLYAKKYFLKQLIEQASIKGEATHRIEKLEDKLESVECDIDTEIIKVYA